MERAPLSSVPRVALARESLWQLDIPGDPSERHVLLDHGGQLVLSAYVAYTDAGDARDFEAYTLPVLRTLASSRSRALLALVESPTSFDAGRVRHALQSARAIGVPAMVEIRGTWGATLLELLAAAGPTYVRLAPELTHGAGSVPDVFRAMVAMSEFARERGLALVARNPGEAQELDAVRVAGVSLVQWTGLPLADGAQRPQPALRR